MAKILLIDDQESFVSLVSQLLTSKGYEVVGMTDGKAALETLEREHFDLVICDVRMQPVNGLNVLRRARERFPRLPVIMLTGYATVDTALEALKFGAFDYIRKPFEMADMVWTVERALNRRADGQDLAQSPAVHYAADDVVANSAILQEVVRGIGTLAFTTIPLLLTGEPGVGKRHLARAVQVLAGRPSSPFYALNCADLAEAGRTPGGAARAGQLGDDLKGCTLCLVNVELLPHAYQAELRDLLGTPPVAGAAPAAAPAAMPSDVRVIATTTADMGKYVEQRLFDADLRDKLGRFTIRVPPLRERREDILPLAHHFLAKRMGSAPVPVFESDVRGALEHHDWPGNVRELKDVIAGLPALEPGRRITRDLLPKALGERANTAEDSGAGEAPPVAQGHWLRQFLRNREAELLGQLGQPSGKS